MGGTDRGTGRKPSKTIIVPNEYLPTIRPQDLENLTNRWHKETGCEVLYTMRSRILVKFDIFGSGAPLEHAIRIINKWIEGANTKSSASSAWAKTPAFDPYQWYYDEINAMEAERKERFKEPMPNGLMPPYQIIVQWPDEFTKFEGKVITPRDVFGNKLEILDSIRVYDEVFITLLTNCHPPWQVEISGFAIENVESAEIHYLNMIEKARTTQFLDSHTINIILDGSEGSEIILERPAEWWPSQALTSPRLLLTQDLMGDLPGSFRKGTLHPDELAKIQYGIYCALEAARFEQGSYDLAVRFGTLSLRGMREKDIGGKYPLISFRKGLEVGVLQCQINRWLVKDDHRDELLERLMNAEHFLEPVKASGGFFGVAPSTFKATKPTLRGTWVFEDPNSCALESPTFKTAIRNSGRSINSSISSANCKTKGGEASPSNLIVVELEWTEDEDGAYEKMAPKFYKLKPGQLKPKEHMDINLLELGGSKGWHFGLESMVLVPKAAISPAIVGFVRRIDLKPGYTRNMESKESFAKWSQSSSVKIKYGRLDKVYTFGIRKTGFRVEAASMWFPSHNLPCWGLSVRHKEWPTRLNELERLPPGSKAGWGDTISTFLPKDGITSASPDCVRSLEFELEDLNVDGKDIPAPRHGIKMLIDKLMQLSLIINCDHSVQTGPSLGNGLAFRTSDLL